MGLEVEPAKGPSRGTPPVLLGCQGVLDAGHSALPAVFLVRMENVSWCDSGFSVPKVLPTRHLGFSL